MKLKLQRNCFGFGDKFNSFQKWKFPKDRQRVRTQIGSPPTSNLLLLSSKVVENNEKMVPEIRQQKSNKLWCKVVSIVSHQVSDQVQKHEKKL